MEKGFEASRRRRVGYSAERRRWRKKGGEMQELTLYIKSSRMLATKEKGKFKL